MRSCEVVSFMFEDLGEKESEGSCATTYVCTGSLLLVVLQLSMPASTSTRTGSFLCHPVD